jgi:hypothetical protein
LAFQVPKVITFECNLRPQWRWTLLLYTAIFFKSHYHGGIFELHCPILGAVYQRGRWHCAAWEFVQQCFLCGLHQKLQKLNSKVITKVFFRQNLFLLRKMTFVAGTYLFTS